MSGRVTRPGRRAGSESKRSAQAQRAQQSAGQAASGPGAGDTAAQLAQVAELLAEAAQKCSRIAEDQLASQPDQSVMGDVQSALDQFPGQARLLTVRDLSEVLGVDRRTIRRWRQRGELPPAFEAGGVIRWRQEVIEAWVLEREGAR